MVSGWEEGERKEMGEGEDIETRWERERILKPEWLACFAHTRCFCDSSSFFRASQASTSPVTRVQTHTSSHMHEDKQCK